MYLPGTDADADPGGSLNSCTNADTRLNTAPGRLFGSISLSCFEKSKPWLWCSDDGKCDSELVFLVV